MDVEPEVFDPEAIPRSDNAHLELVDRLGIREEEHTCFAPLASSEILQTPASWSEFAVDVGTRGTDSVRHALQRVMLSMKAHIQVCGSGPEPTICRFQVLATSASNALAVERELRGILASNEHGPPDADISDIASATGASTAEYIDDEYVYVRKERISSTCDHFRFAPSVVDSAVFENPDIPSRWFDFQLDDLQKQAIGCVHIRESCLVSAHTSAGKTAVAEFAIRQSLHRRKRIIYTSPLKALSNQKFADFSKRFSDVGLMTGDNTIAPQAHILIMTTEILHSMLFRLIDEAASFDEFEWVIFDEAQFLADDERGYCWEECIILLPDHICVLLLTATTPNSDQLASWIASVRFAPVHCVQTSSRPVPLRHRVFRCGLTESKHSFVEKRHSFYDVHTRSGMLNADTLARIVDPSFTRKRIFITASLIGSLNSFLQALEAQLRQEAAGSLMYFPRVSFLYDDRRASSNGDDGLVYEVQIDDSEESSSWSFDEVPLFRVRTRVRSDIFMWLAQEVDRSPSNMHEDSESCNDVDEFEKMFCVLRREGKFPLIVFCFSRWETEKLALDLSGRRRMDLTTLHEKEEIRKAVSERLGHLESLNLEQVTNAVMLLERGFGVHHGGIVPFLRDLTEQLFAASLVKVVFATETFSVGINMPARTVVFCGLSKFDGKCRRPLSAGEYKQMSGRAGRRGIDVQGESVVMFGRQGTRRPPHGRSEYDSLEEMYSARVSDVQSSFTLRWNTLLNLMRLGPAHLNMMLTKSFMGVSKSIESMDKSKTGCFGMVQALQELSFLDLNYAVLPKGAMVQLLLTPFDPVLFAECVTSPLMPSVAFSHLSPSHIVAVCSAFVSEGRPTREPAPARGAVPLYPETACTGEVFSTTCPGCSGFFTMSDPRRPSCPSCGSLTKCPICMRSLEFPDDAGRVVFLRQLW
mmetsp:Transcript_58349/g.131437  ORF Transcript_58349/g.131437 Transcript_58349/m.131437 type:complete len:925 (-) Transcript_58349:1155-3929(-)